MARGEMHGSLESDGELIPFPTGCDQDARWFGSQLYDDERDVLDDLAVRVWCMPENLHDDRLENYRIELCVFYGDNPCSRPLIDMLKLKLTGEDCGNEEEIAALEKLKTGIDEIIAKLRR